MTANNSLCKTQATAGTSTLLRAAGGERYAGRLSDFGYTALGSQTGESTSYASEEDDGLLRPRRRSIAYALQRLFGKGHDVESADDHHHYTREERQRLNNIESIDYLPPNSAVFRAWLARQPYK